MDGPSASGPMISADGHIDFPLLPENLWRDGAPAALRERMPRVVDSPRGRTWVSHQGTPLGLVGGMGSAGRPYVPGEIHRSDRMAEHGLYRDQSRGLMRPAIPELRVRDQELDGVCGEVVYGILGAASRLDDPEVTDCVTHTYNGWLAEFCRKAPGRFAGIGCLSSAQPEGAALELRRCAELGLGGAEVGMSHDMLPLWHPSWEPIWRASHETGLPVHIHTIGPRADTRFMNDPKHYRPWLATHMTAFQIPMMAVCAAVIFGGALERHPNLSVVIGEAGIGWLPYALERFDYEWEDQFRDLIPRPPSEYWRRQMFATFQIDRTGLENLARIGAETVMWGSDFPHPDGTWPDSREILRPQLVGIAPHDQRKILYENAARLYRLPLAG
ncbi:MAG TPA: amidohydrolase family protein [Myxococcota bacterium]|nr:amidohydrolase family protein [Myxococcota bacterium]